MVLLALTISIILYQILWYFLIPDFKIRNIFYFLSPIITMGFLGIWYFYHQMIDISLIPYLLIILTLSNLSFVDCKYYEVSGKSYWFLLVPACVILFMTGNQMYLNLLSFVLMFATFWIIDKLVGIEKIGGADIKILFILALTITMWDSLMLVILSFFVDVIIFVFSYPIHKILKKEGAVKIPMIVAISIAWIILCFMAYQI